MISDDATIDILADDDITTDVTTDDTIDVNVDAVHIDTT